jgi:hypothetical protein
MRTIILAVFAAAALSGCAIESSYRYREVGFQDRRQRGEEEILSQLRSLESQRQQPKQNTRDCQVNTYPIIDGTVTRYRVECFD